MKINSQGIERYQSVVKQVKTGDDAHGKTSAGKLTSAKTDKVTISGDGAARAEISRLASSIAAEVDSPASSERIDGLRQAVEQGTYNVPSEDIADAMLDIFA